jgi:chromosome transmission fidelity protein 1
MTWLRNHKSTEYESSLVIAKEDFKDEPQWIIDQLLRRKRDELSRQWEERERKLVNIKMREKAMEDRANKRRRVDKVDARRIMSEADEDEEFLLDWQGGSADDEQDPLSGLTASAKQILTQIGLGKGNASKDDEVDEKADNQVKVSKSGHQGTEIRMVTRCLDLLYFKNAFSVNAVHI